MTVEARKGRTPSIARICHPSGMQHKRELETPIYLTTFNLWLPLFIMNNWSTNGTTAPRIDLVACYLNDGQSRCIKDSLEWHCRSFLLSAQCPSAISRAAGSTNRHISGCWIDSQTHIRTKGRTLQFSWALDGQVSTLK